MALYRLKGGAIEEKRLLRETGISHGSLSAARKELAEGGFLRVEKVGRMASYQLTEKGIDELGFDAPAAAAPAASAPAEKPPAGGTKATAKKPPAPYAQRTTVAKPRPSGQEMAAFHVSDMPRVTGTFADRDDWEDTLTARIGGCVNIDEEDDGLFRVQSSDYDEETVYYVTEDEDGFHVS